MAAPSSARPRPSLPGWGRGVSFPGLLGGRRTRRRKTFGGTRGALREPRGRGATDRGGGSFGSSHGPALPRPWEPGPLPHKPCPPRPSTAYSGRRLRRRAGSWSGSARSTHVRAPLTGKFRPAALAGQCFCCPGSPPRYGRAGLAKVLGRAGHREALARAHLTLRIVLGCEFPVLS